MRHYILPNGIPVILVPQTGTQAVTALVMFKVGSRNETKTTNGISHFLEHLFFKGTERRPTTLELSKELDGVGADFNAFTGKDYTGYYVKVANQHTGLAIDILEDLLFHPLFNPAEIDRERGVIIEEINMYDDNPMVTAEELAEQLLFGEHHPLGYKIAGPPSNIRAVTRAQILRYREQFYRPNNMVIVLAGGLPGNTFATLKKAFGSVSIAHTAIKPAKPFRSRQRRQRAVVAHKPTAQAHVAISFASPHIRSKDLPAIKVLSTIFGGSMSSRLFINIRERQGLCYYIRSGVSPYVDSGAFTIQGGMDTTRIKQALTGISVELGALARAGVTDEELAGAKEFLAGKMALRFEDSEEVANYWGRQALFGTDHQAPADQLTILQAVSTRQINAVIKKYLRPEFANLVVVGPYTKRQQASFTKLLQW